MNPFKLFLIIGFIGFCASATAQDETISFAPAQKMTKAINSDAEESFPVISADGKKMYFARTFHASNKGGKYSGQDVWTSDLIDDTFDSAKNFSEINTKKSDVVVGTTVNGNRLYLLNQTNAAGDPVPGLSVINYSASANKWSDPKAVVIPDLNITTEFYSAYVSPDENFILWSLPVEGKTQNNDLFISLSGDQGTTWTQPIPLGSEVNSANDEISPFYDTQKKLLFFSANRPENPDDYDIYYSKLQDDSWTQWSEPVNPGNALNSKYFDAYFYSTEDGTAYFSSNRNDSLSSIYLTDLTISKPVLDSLEMVDADLEVERREPVLIIETSASGKQVNRSLETMTKAELLDSETYIRFVYFDYDKYDISAKYIEVLDAVARILDEYPYMTLRIEGHTDAIGSDAYNKVLSDNRAAAAKEFLVINGVIPERIANEGIGEKDPYASNLTDEGRALNRRVELFFREK
ncbi:OmpA family protein [Cryomorpha ignava]|uniref:OmpA family protein n=1 Tax=Cryomorpha ignava TaxID=101383 RepID=A0A7K3WND2_9FLAO|nr:OmpA family protein [Cryomorpha ignava]NEN23159.1 OmpA family protein [Cryomorpha ignava]